MTLLPVIGRELRATARQSFTYSVRMMGVAALVVGSGVGGVVGLQSLAPIGFAGGAVRLCLGTCVGGGPRFGRRARGNSIFSTRTARLALALGIPDHHGSVNREFSRDMVGRIEHAVVLGTPRVGRREHGPDGFVRGRVGAGGLVHGVGTA